MMAPLYMQVSIVLFLEVVFVVSVVSLRCGVGSYFVLGLIGICASMEVLRFLKDVACDRHKFIIFFCALKLLFCSILIALWPVVENFNN